MNPAESEGSGQDDDISWLERVHGVLVGVKADEPLVLGHVDCIAVLLFDTLVARVQAFIKNVCHGSKRDGPFVLNVEGVGGGTGAATTAAHQGDLKSVVLGRVHLGQSDT